MSGGRKTSTVARKQEPEAASHGTGERPEAGSIPPGTRKSSSNVESAPATKRMGEPAPRRSSPARRRTPAEDSDAPLQILMVAPEAAPFAKTGGLADVAGSLPLALGRLGHNVTVVLPRYRGIDAGREQATLELALGGRGFKVRYGRVPAGERVTYLLVDVPELYDREALYGIGSIDYSDNDIRFAVLARAAVEYVSRVSGTPTFSIVHAHEWQSGLVPVYLRGRLPCVFTIHNLAFQGLFPPATLSRIDVPPHLFNSEGLEYWGQVSYLKAGINFSDWITTVSPRYAKEILTGEYGFGFEGILSARKDVLSGILNGIDGDAWDPQRDPELPARYGPDDLSGKLKDKAAVLRAFRLPAEASALDRPLVGMVSRLTDQKGFDLISQGLPGLLKLDASYVLLGSGEARYEEQWQAVADAHPDRVGVRIGFDESLAHLVEAGADIFLMPSRFEPCGLNQMYSLRYGTVPVVRATGGLDDTVVNYNERSGRGTGFKFAEYTAPALVRTMKRAIKVFGDRKKWRALQLAGMRQDFSWDVSAREYVKVYRSVRRRFDGIR